MDGIQVVISQYRLSVLYALINFKCKLVYKNVYVYSGY